MIRLWKEYHLNQLMVRPRTSYYDQRSTYDVHVPYKTEELGRDSPWSNAGIGLEITDFKDRYLVNLTGAGMLRVLQGTVVVRGESDIPVCLGPYTFAQFPYGSSIMLEAVDRVVARILVVQHDLINGNLEAASQVRFHAWGPQDFPYTHLVERSTIATLSGLTEYAQLGWNVGYHALRFQRLNNIHLPESDTFLLWTKGRGVTIIDQGEGSRKIPPIPCSPGSLIDIPHGYRFSCHAFGEEAELDMIQHPPFFHL